MIASHTSDLLLRDAPAAGSGRAYTEALCAIDGSSESLAAVKQASALTGPGGHLTLLLVTSYRFLGDHRSPAMSPLDAERVLEQAAAVADSTGVSYVAEVDPDGPPSSVIRAWAAAHDLLAIGAPSSSWFSSLLLGGVAASAERSLATSLLIARPLPAGISPRLLVASDGLEGSDELVAHGARLAAAQGAEAVLVHALGAHSESRPHRIARQARSLERATRESSLQVLPGGASAVICALAEQLRPSLVVMSSRRRGGMRAIGSVSRRVVHEGSSPVLLVPPERLLAVTTS